MLREMNGRIAVELNVTLACQAGCANCDRLCDKFLDRTEHMELGQVAEFLSQARRAGGVAKVRVLGGEPTLHPQIEDILDLLEGGLDERVIGRVELGTNCLTPDWTEIARRHPQVDWQRSPLRRKKHLPFVWAPLDLGLTGTAPCRHPVQCGFSLDSRGWLPCSPAIAISRLFFDGKHYRQEMPAGIPWGQDELCPLCVYSLARSWHVRHRRHLADITPEMRVPTRRWAEALERAGLR